ncbi:Expansin A17, ALPHA 1.13,EXPA17 [Hibiscus syriacus]|uniref:Expansin A17, ALPHA 1.13,EXPA17 n=1 Tax=Hibiscus syriacus TaxID=106335 RepID=A0A6A2ZZJ7_HIBSY|nr:Expansin A17, ALPHA 1.13,EXPA17 [Hibiscus syriacus]
MLKKNNKNFRKRSFEEDEGDDPAAKSDDEEDRRLALEEVKFLQKQRERKSGIPAIPTVQTGGVVAKVTEKVDADGEKEELVLQDTFAQETAVLVEDPNMIEYVEQELAKKRGRNMNEKNEVENDLTRAEDELYKIPEHLKVKKRNSEESSTQWTTGIAEVQLPIEYKLRNIVETEAAKKLLQEKRLMVRAKSEVNIPSSYSADYFQRGWDYAEILRREHPELYKDRGSQDDNASSKTTDASNRAVNETRQIVSYSRLTRSWLDKYSDRMDSTRARTRLEFLTSRNELFDTRLEKLLYFMIIRESHPAMPLSLSNPRKKLMHHCLLSKGRKLTYFGNLRLFKVSTMDATRSGINQHINISPEMANEIKVHSPTINRPSERAETRTRSKVHCPNSYVSYIPHRWFLGNKGFRVRVELGNTRAQLGSFTPLASNDAAGSRQAATDQFMLERFRKRERQRVMRR